MNRWIDRLSSASALFYFLIFIILQFIKEILVDYLIHMGGDFVATRLLF
jgi:hypothetical protein